MFKYIFLVMMLFNDVHAMLRSLFSMPGAKPSLMRPSALQRSHFYCTRTPHQPYDFHHSVVEDPATNLLMKIQGIPITLQGSKSKGHAFSGWSGSQNPQEPKDPSVWTKDPNGKTVLHLACEQGDLESVGKILNIEYGTDRGDFIFDQDELGNNSLHYAVESNAEDVVTLLCDAAQQVKTGDGESAKKALITAKNKNEHSALFCAIQRGNPKIVAILLHSFGSSVDHFFRLEEGKTYLHWAVQFEHRAIIEMLLQYAGTAAPHIILAADQNAKTPLDYAREKPDVTIELILMGKLGHLSAINVASE